MKKVMMTIIMLAAILGLMAQGYKTSTTDSQGCVYEHGRFAGSLTIGSTTLVSAGAWDGYVAKYNEEGKAEWARQIKTKPYYSVQAQDIECDNLGNVYIAGHGPASGTQFGPLSYTYSSRMWQGYVAKLDAETGNWLWVQPITSSYTVSLADIDIDETGNIYLAGSYQYAMAWYGEATAGYGNMDGFIAKLNPDGKMIWWNKMGGKLMDWCANVELDGYGRIYVVGQFSDVSASIGGFTVQNFNSRGNVPDGWVGLVNCADGKWLWVQTVPNNGSDYITHVATDEYGNGYVCGAYTRFQQSTLKLGATTLNYYGNLDTYIAMIDAKGSWVWARGFGGAGYEWADELRYKLGEVQIDGHSNAAIRIGSTTLPAGQWSARISSSGEIISAGEGWGTAGQ